MNEDIDLGEGGVELAWDDVYCDSLIGRMVRFNGNAYLVANQIDSWGNATIKPGTYGWVVSALPPASDQPEWPVQFRMHWHGHPDLMYVDATCVTVLASVPDLQDSEAVGNWLAAS